MDEDTTMDAVTSCVEILARTEISHQLPRICIKNIKTLTFVRQTEEVTAETKTKAIEKEKEVLKELNVEENAVEKLKHSVATHVKMHMLLKAVLLY